MAETKKYDIFISYADEDVPWVEGYLLDALENAGITYQDEAAFQLGVPRILEFERSIQESQRTLLVMSPAYMAEEFNQFIDVLAQSYGLETTTWPVIPVILREVDLPPRLSQLVAVDLTDPNRKEAELARLFETLGTPLPEPPTIPACPYPGMVPFTEADSQRFFGRDAEIQEIVNRLRLHPFVTVIGPSGSGKSSLVFAGVIPALRKSRLFGEGEWLIRTMRPGNQPLEVLGNALGGNPAAPGVAVKNLIAGHPEAGRLLLVVDQFEELFTLGSQDTLSFQEVLQTLFEIPNMFVIITMRADFYGEIMASPLWQAFQSHRLEVPPMGEEELRAAIVRPAEDAGVFIETALVERLIADAVGEPGVLPLVQETLVLLWERVERRFLPFRAYESLVLTRGAYGAERTGIQVAMARRADATYGSLPEEGQIVARRVFLRLIQFGEGRADTRRQQPLTQLQSVGENPKTFESTIQQLTSNRLLTLTSEENGDRRVDISHESLITGWPTLQDWIEARREAEQTRRRLETKAAEWVRLGGGEGGLLDEYELLEAKSWINSPDGAELGGSENLHALIAKSEEVLEAAERAAEEARQRELEQAHKLAHTQRQRAWVFAIGFVVAIILLIVAGSLYIQNTQTLELAQTAQANAESAKATSEIDRDNAINQKATAEAAEAEALVQQSLAEEQRATAIAASAKAAAQEQIAISEADLSDSTRLGLVGISFQDRELDKSLLLGINALTITDTFEARLNLLTGLEKQRNLQVIMRGHKSYIEAMAISPDGNTLASIGCSDITGVDFFTQESTCPESSIFFWDLTTFQKITEIEHVHEGSASALAFSPDGEWLVSGGEDNLIKIWDVEQKELVTQLEGHTAPIHSLAFYPDGNWLASIDQIGDIHLWDLSSGTKLEPIFHKAPRLSPGSDGEDNFGSDFFLKMVVKFSPDGQYLVANDPIGGIWWWEFNTNTPRGGANLILSPEEEDPLFYLLDFSPKGDLLAGVDDFSLNLWGINDDSYEDTDLPILNDPVLALKVREDNVPFILTADGEGWIYTDQLGAPYWDGNRWVYTEKIEEPDWEPTTQLEKSPGFISSIILQPEENRLLLGDCVNEVELEGISFCENGAVSLWSLDYPTPRAISRTLGANENADTPHQVLAFDETGDTFWAYTPSTGTALQRDFQTGDVLQEFDTGIVIEIKEPRKTALSSQGWLAIAQDTSVEFHHITKETGNKIVSVTYHEDPITAIAFSRDGTLFASQDETGQVQILDTTTFDVIYSIKSQRGVGAIAIRDDGLLAISRTGGVEIWELETGDQIMNTPWPFLGIMDMEFSPDGGMLVLLPENPITSKVVLWELDLEQEAGSFLFPDSIDTVRFHPSGDSLLTAAYWGSPVLEINPDFWIETGCSIANRNFTHQEWSLYMGDDPYEITCQDYPEGEQERQ